MAEKLNPTYALVGKLTMGNNQLFEQYIECTHDPPHQSSHNTVPHKPTNRQLQILMKMAHPNDKMDLESDNAAEQPGRMTTRASARLLEKLKKLQDTPKPDQDPMECDPDEAKKQTRATTPQGGGQQAHITTKPDGHSHDIKQSQNGATPTPIAKAKHEDRNIENHLSGDKENLRHEEVMESIVEDEDPEDDSKPAAISQGTNQPDTEAETNQKKSATASSEEEAKLEENNGTTLTNQAEALTVALAEANKERPDNQPVEAADGDPDTSDVEPEPIREVDPKEWRRLHDEWLHAAMRAAMGDTTLTMIPDLDNVECMERNPPQHRIEVDPIQPMVRRYDL